MGSCFRRNDSVVIAEQLIGWKRAPKSGQLMLSTALNPPLPTGSLPIPPMKNQDILSQIAEFCRHADMAESTFGRRAVNDGKLVQRLREGKRITIDTLNRIQAYIAASTGTLPPPRGLEVPPEKRDPRGNFRFFENRQKYLLFVHTCSEKRVIAERVALELSSLHPRPPALRGRPDLPRRYSSHSRSRDCVEWFPRPNVGPRQILFSRSDANRSPSDKK